MKLNPACLPTSQESSCRKPLAQKEPAQFSIYFNFTIFFDKAALIAHSCNAIFLITHSPVVRTEKFKPYKLRKLPSDSL